MKGKLRILHTESSTGWGGQEIRILTEIKGMLARGHELTLLCPSSAEIAPAAKRQGIDVVEIPIEQKRVSSLWRLRQWMPSNVHRYQVINTHSSTDSWLVAVAGLTLSNFPPVVRTRHVSTAVNRSRSTRWLYQTVTRHIVTTGEALRRQLHCDNGFALETMTSVPTGVDLQQFFPRDRAECRRSLGLNEQDNYIGIVATLRDWKGHVYLFDAVSQLPASLSHWKLLVIGDGPYEPALRAKVAQLGLIERVRFVGRQENVADWMNAVDLFVLPSYGDEGVPQSIVQAMACSLPVISTPIGSIAEAVVDAETGCLVAPRDSAALARAIADLAQQPARRAEYGKAGLARAREKFDIERMLDRMEEVFYMVAGSA